MSHEHVDVIATTISGSIEDWKKVERIVPLFAEHGMKNVQLHVADSHRAARERSAASVAEGVRTVISAGGSGTFNAVLEGCCDSGVPLGEIHLGFLRKGSADLIGKVLGMPDEIVAAIDVFATSIREGRTVPCDVLLAEAGGGESPPRHFVGYGGAGIFGRIPHITENPLTRWYKGVLGQFFGDLGPFTVGMSVASIESLLQRPFRGRELWRIRVDGADRGVLPCHALIIVNGYLGKDLPYSDAPLGAGSFELFVIKDSGVKAFMEQAIRARDGSIMEEAERLGVAAFMARDHIDLAPVRGGRFEANVDGATLHCRDSVSFSIVDSIRLISRD